MKSIIAVLILSTFTSVYAKENIICGISSKDGKIIQRGVLDLDSSKEIENVFYNNKTASLNMEQHSPEFITVSLSSKDEHHAITLNREMVLAMSKAKSFAMFPNLEQDGVICYNMKDGDLAPFDQGYLETRMPASTEKKLDSCSDKIVQGNMPKTNLFEGFLEKGHSSNAVSK